jgi:hypothetical protein
MQACSGYFFSKSKDFNRVANVVVEMVVIEGNDSKINQRYPG